MNNLNLIIYFSVLHLLVSCNSQTKNTTEEQPVKNAFIDSLVEKQILENEYAISIPPDYYIDTLNAADFVVYYIQPIDTSKSTFAAGIYFGNHPSLFNYSIGYYEKTTIEKEILGENVKWTIDNRDTTYLVETLIHCPYNEYWREFIHVFGNARTPSDLDRLFDIFSTFSEKKPSIVLDSIKQKAAKLVLKVTMCENDGGSKFIWEKAKVLSEIHNPSGYQLPDTISIAHYSWLQGLPEKTPCIVYLIPYPSGSEEPSDIDRWMLLEGDGRIGSVVYSSWNKQQEINAAITELIALIEKRDIKTLMQYSTKKIYCPLCADFFQEDLYESYINNNVFYEKCFNHIFDEELIQRIKWGEKEIRLEKSEHGNYFILYTIYRPNESGGGHEGAEFGFWLNEEDDILKLSGVITIP